MSNAPNRASRDREPASFGRALVLAGLILLGSLAQTLHHATVGHAVCPEHGELVHVALPHGHDAATGIVPHAHEAQRCEGEDENEDVDASTTALAEPSEAPAEHDPCLLSTLLRPGSSPWLATNVRVVPQAEPCRPAVVHAAVRAAAVAPLTFAPKHSPPARAA